MNRIVQHFGTGTKTRYILLPIYVRCYAKLTTTTGLHVRGVGKAGKLRIW